MGSMHENSRASYDQCKEDGNFHKLIWFIARFYELNKGRAFTDREVKDQLFAAGKLPFNDMNMVRPKITKLKDDGFVVEVEDVLDPQTDRFVRKVKWLEYENEKDLFNGIRLAPKPIKTEEK